MATQQATGSCLCKKVQFIMHGSMRDIMLCHCHQCQKQTGHFLAATDIADDKLEFVQDEGLAWYASSDAAKRGFCKYCGSTLFYKLHERTRTSIAVGAFDSDVTGLKATSHIFMEDKKDYYDVSDGLPQYNTY